MNLETRYVLPHSSFFVTTGDTWTVHRNQAGGKGNDMSLLTEAPSLLSSGKFALIFKDDHDVKTFLDDPNPDLSGLQDFVKMVRTYDGYLVMTVDQVFARLGQPAPSELGDATNWWMRVLSHELVISGDAPAPGGGALIYRSLPFSAHPFNSLAAPSGWSYPLVITNEMTRYRFLRWMQQRQALELAAQRQPQSLLDGTDVLVRYSQDWSGFTMIGWDDHERVVIVPDDQEHPVVQGFSESDDDHEGEWSSWVPATAYPCLGSVLGPTWARECDPGAPEHGQVPMDVACAV